MKKNDIILVISVMAVSSILALVTTPAFVVGSKLKNQQVQTVTIITPSFTTPSTSYFNSSSIDSTKSITIGNNSNGAPFSAKN